VEHPSKGSMFTRKYQTRMKVSYICKHASLSCFKITAVKSFTAEPFVWPTFSSFCGKNINVQSVGFLSFHPLALQGPIL
jgi:hypothetical protein